MVRLVESARLRVIILGSISALGSLATHMVVPVLPTIAQRFGVSGASAQLVLTAYLIALAIGQIVSGPAIDRLGQRPMIVAGGTIFAIGSLLCWTVSGLALLVTARVVQALGAACGLVAARAIVGSAQGKGAAREMALLSAIVMLSPIFAPMLGSAVSMALGWHAIFGLLTLVSIAATFGAARWIFLPTPSHPVSRGPMISGWRRVIADRCFLRHLAISSMMSGGLYAFLASAPFFLTHQFGFSQGALGVIFGIVACGAGCGALLASVLAPRLGDAGLIRLGSVVAFSGALLQSIFALAAAGAVTIIVAMSLYALGGGLILPNAIIRALSNMGNRVATAVSMYGAIQMAVGGIFTLLVGGFAGGGLGVTAIVILGCATIAATLGLRSS